MLRKTMLALALLALLGLAAAQISIFPTVNDSPDKIAKGADSASVPQTVVMNLPAATALHLTASTIEFDLAYLDGPEWAMRATGDPEAEGLTGNLDCVYVKGIDARSNLGFDFWGQEQVVPGGIAYKPVSWDDNGIKINLEYLDGTLVPDDARVVTYPPIRLNSDGKLVDGSKDYFVCYQSFVIQLFSNWENFHLQVSRTDLADDDGDLQSIKHLYVQGNTCPEFTNTRGTGLYELRNGATRELLPRRLTAGPTGSRTLTNACNPNSSWMDVLGVLAVKVNADLYGPSTANLTYTLISTTTNLNPTAP